MDKKVIWKFELSIENCGELQKIDMPVGAQILSAINQGGKLVLYALVDVDKAKLSRLFKVYMTGQEFRPDNNIHFVDTVSFGGGEFIVHVFEINRW